MVVSELHFLLIVNLIIREIDSFMDRQITKQSIEGLISKLGLPEGDVYCQDWEYEIASPEMAVKLLMDYIEQKDLTEDEKFTLMHVILESINDFISNRSEKFPLLEEFRMVALRDYYLHKETFEYWASWEQADIDEAFEITPIIRGFIAEAERNE